MKRTKLHVVTALVLCAILCLSGCAIPPAQPTDPTQAPAVSPQPTQETPTADPNATPYLTFDERFTPVREVDASIGTFIGEWRTFVLNGVEWSVTEEEFLSTAYGLEGVKLNDESMRYHEYLDGDVHIVIPAERFRFDGVDVQFRMSHAFLKETGKHAAASLSTWRCEADWETFRQAAFHLAYIAFHRVQGPGLPTTEHQQKLDERFMEWARELLAEDEPEALHWERTLAGSNADLRLTVQYKKDGEKRIDMTATVKDVGTLAERILGDGQFVPAQDLAWGTDRETLVPTLPGMQDVVLDDALHWYTSDEDGFYAASKLQDSYYEDGVFVYRHGYSFDAQGKLDAVSFSTTNEKTYEWTKAKESFLKFVSGIHAASPEEGPNFEAVEAELNREDFRFGHWWWQYGDTVLEATLIKDAKVPEGCLEPECSVDIRVWGPDAAEERLVTLRAMKD